MPHQQNQWQFSGHDFLSFPAPTVDNNWFPQPGFGASNSNQTTTKIATGDVQTGYTGIDRQMTMRILSQASADDLMRAQNAAYMILFADQNKLQGQIDSQKHFIETLLQNRPQTVPNPSSADRLNSPTAPALCKREDYEDVKFWTKDEWKKHQSDCKTRNKECGKLDFLTDENNKKVSPTRLAAMSTKARELFTTLRRHKRDPDSWGARGAEEAEYFSNCMRVTFPEFGWCENDWKVHAFATERYPDWYNGGGHLRMKPKRKTSESGSENEDVPKRKKKKSQTHRKPPPQASIIDLDDDEPDAATDKPQKVLPRPRPITSSSAKPTTASTSAGNATNADDVTGQGHDLVLQDATNKPLPPLSPPLGDIQVPRSPALASELPSDEGSTNRAQSSGTSPQPDLATPVQVSGAPALELPAPAPATAQESVLLETSNALPQVQDPASTVLPRRNTDLFNDLPIPKPSTQVAQVNSSTVTASGSGSKQPRKGKPMVPTKALTARNLFAIDHLKDHPDTTAAEFKPIYDGLAADVKKRYEDLSKTKKAEDVALKKVRIAAATEATTT